MKNLALPAILIFFTILSGCTSGPMKESTSFEHFEDAKNIRSVWELETQPCNGSFANSMSQYKDADKIRKTKEIILHDLGFSFKVPQLPRVGETVIKLHFKNRDRGVVDNYILISDQDFKAPFASVVMTELPSGMSEKKALSTVIQLEKRLAGGVGENLKFKKISGPHGNTLEVLVKNRVGSHCFPTSDFKFLPKASKLSSTGISRFTVINSMLVEFSIIIIDPIGANNQESTSFAKSVMDDYWTRLIAIQ